MDGGSDRGFGGAGALLTDRLVTGQPGPGEPAGARGGRDATPPMPGAIAWEHGSLTYVGPAQGLGSDVTARRASGAVVPGFVDCHTHLPFVGWRADEFEARVSGRTYRDLQGGGGGIFRSSRLLAEATDEEVLAFCRPLLREMLDHGTTALELKTGYGLSVEAELRQARLARGLAAGAAQTCTVTLLACHAVPQGISHADWVRVACEELIPTAVAEGLVDAVDVYVEDIAFSLEDLDRVAEAAAAAELPLRVHADQLGPSGAAEAAVRLGARSADHLNHVSAAGTEALGTAERTTAVLLPASTFFLGADPPDVSALLGAGARIALASDFNPGTSPTLSMPEVIAIASALYRMTAADAMTSVTLRAAEVLGLADRLGTLEAGKRADFLVLDSADLAMVPYRPGHNPVVETYVAGERVGGGDAAMPA
ncbi:MAG: imidazolonepropionase [Actinomycetota bacterium]|nr:imidazolonepropionase [Actinomycetota bacterium]